MDSLFTWWPWADLDLFYGKVRFGPLCFCMGKGENDRFFRNYHRLHHETCISWPQWQKMSVDIQYRPRGHPSIRQFFKHLLWSHWASWSPIAYGASKGRGNHYETSSNGPLPNLFKLYPCGKNVPAPGLTWLILGKSSCLKLEGSGLWYLVCNFILWTSTKFVQTIALGSKVAPLRVWWEKIRKIF